MPRQIDLVFLLCLLLLDLPGHAETSQYSPGVKPDYPTELLWGDTHLHSSWSMDAFGFGNNRLAPEAAFRFARGEQLTTNNGMSVRLTRPLDFLVVADHAEYLGFVANLASGNKAMIKTELGARWHSYIKSGDTAKIFAEFVESLRGGTQPKVDDAISQSIWSNVAATADQMNEPGQFTAFTGYEWTSMPGGNNLHRVVIFRDGAELTTQTLPFSTQDSEDPEALWEALDAYVKKTGGDVLAIPHNGNLSNGQMFSVTTWKGEPLSADYAKKRSRWEPLYEVTQVKGDAEAHSRLSPDDEYADYETWDAGNLGRVQKKEWMLKHEYARSALKLGLELNQRLGVNPFKFGLQGGTDIHTSLSTADDNNFFGKFPDSYPGANRLSNWMGGDKASVTTWKNWTLASSGYTAVWAEENTRLSIFEALRRKEVYATTGPRIYLRYFAGWNFDDEDAVRPNAVEIGYRKGVPMGADLIRTSKNKHKTPGLLILAAKDPEGANLERVQVIKGWVDSKGISHEKIYNAALKIDTKAKDTTLNHTVDLSVPAWTNTIGSVQFLTVWHDPDYDPTQAAFYYVRVIEIPTPRWTAYDAVYFGVDIDPAIPVIHQERAYGSPIWYTPGN